MGIPDYESIMLPLLQLASDTQEHSLRGAIEALANSFALSADERKEMLPSGRQATFDNRVGWARTYLKKAGLLESTRRGYFRITTRGLHVLAEKPSKINVGFLKRYPEFLEFQAPQEKQNGQKADGGVDENWTPQEEMERAYQFVRRGLMDELLQTIKNCSPAFFEQVVIDLLVQMGYGGTRKDAGQAVGGSGDGGIDGIIKEDRLGLDIVYIQAKRWENTVSRPEIQKFAGALQGQRAKKGIFITTSDFSQLARDYIASIDNKIVLIDGNNLAQLMIDFNVGVTTMTSYELKRIDADYFTE